jgi:hypothetical protein
MALAKSTEFLAPVKRHFYTYFMMHQLQRSFMPTQAFLVGQRQI